MSDYRTGDMIRLTRQAAGMSQEALCENICSVQTLSRIENGKVSVKKEVYRMLMERMGRGGEKMRSILETADFDALELWQELNQEIIRFDFDAAKEQLDRFKCLPDSEKSLLNRQMTGRRECLIAYYKKEMGREVYVKRLEELLALTVSGYEKLLDRVYPFRSEEVQLLMNLSNAYGAAGEFERPVRINYMLIRSLNAGYMGREDSENLIAMLTYNTAKRYGQRGQFKTAQHMCQNAIRRAKRQKFLNVLPHAYGELAWSIMQQIRRGERGEEDCALCRAFARQGYAAAQMMHSYSAMRTFEKYFREWFGEEIEAPYQNWKK